MVLSLFRNLCASNSLPIFFRSVGGHVSAKNGTHPYSIQTKMKTNETKKEEAKNNNKEKGVASSNMKFLKICPYLPYAHRLNRKVRPFFVLFMILNWMKVLLPECLCCL